jgi:WhiB family redox-sensing transcriptional regulator
VTARRNLEWSDGAAGPVLAAEGDWHSRAACKTADPDLFFPPPSRAKKRSRRGFRAKAICAACPVRTECLEYAVDNRIEFGVWGGLNEDERPRAIALVVDDGRRKTCCRCGEEKPLNAFYRRADAPDGRQSRCKPCEERDRMSRAAA